MINIKKIILTYITIEIFHYGYLLYKLNFSRKKNILNNQDKKKLILSDNKISEYLKIDNKSEEKYDLDTINNTYNHIRNNYNINDISNFQLITPYSLILRLVSTGYFFYYLYLFKMMGFQIIITPESILIERKSSEEKLFVFHSGVLGNIHHIIDFIKEIDQNYSIMIFIFRPNVITMFWNNSNLLEHIKFIETNINSYKDIKVYAHSFGAFVLENLYNYSPNIISKISNEILVQPGNILSMGLIFISSRLYNFLGYYKFISKYSKLSKHNFFFTYMVKSLAGTSTISCVNNFNGIRFKPRETIKGILILSNDDPLINLKQSHPFNSEIEILFPNHKIISIPGYHGITLKEHDIIINCIKEIIHSKN